MSTINYLTVRNTILPVVRAVTGNYSTLTGSTITGSAIVSNAIATSAITVSTLNLASTTISLGQSTNQTYNNFSNGSYLTWATAKEAMTTANKTVQSANGLYQMIVGNATSGLYLSSDSGITWSTLTGGLPTLTGSAYWSDGAISANGQYITLSIYGGSLWMSADYGRTFALTNQPTPNIWLPLNGNTTDLMGSSTVTTPGTVPGYVTLNYPGYTAQAVNLANTAGGTATRYVRGTWTGSPNFTVSLWFNAQTVNGTLQPIFEANYSGFGIFINTNNVLYFQFPNGGASGNTQLQTQFTLSVNTWYYVTAMFQTNGLCSFYVNNTLIASSTNTGGVGAIPSSGFFGVGTFDTVTTNAFNGYVDDVKITHSVSTYVPIPLLQPNIWLPFENTAGDLGSYSLPPSATPLIYLPFEGNVTDSMSFSTVTTPGTVPGYVPVNREGYTGQAVNLANTAGSNATRYVRGTWTGAANFTVSFWMNPQSLTSVQQQVFVAYTGSMVVYITGSNQLAWYMPSGGGTTALTIGTTSFALVTNTWYYVTIIFQTSGVCSFYVNNALIATYTNVSGVGTLTTTQFSLGCNDNSIISSFNGYIDDLRIYNSAIPYVPVSVTTVTGSLSYVPGVVGLNAVNLVNTAGVGATNFVRGAWSGANNFTMSGWFSMSTFQTGGGNVHLFFAYTGVFGVYCNPSQQLQYFIPNGGATAGLNIAASNKISLNTWYHIYCTFRTGGLCELYINGSLIGSATNTGGVGTLSTTQFAIGTLDNSTSGAFDGYVDDFRIYNAAIPYHILFPQNYRSLALSGTGQYALASAASGWVVGSSNSSQTWSKQTACVGTQNEFIQPQLTGLGANTWIANDVTWTASASSNIANANYAPYAVFNNSYANVNPLGWADSGSSYNATTGAYTGTVFTTIETIGNSYGVWIQLQSSISLILNSYRFASAVTAANIPKVYYWVGSNDGTTWYPLQYASFTTTPITTAYTTSTTNLLVNYTGTQAVQGNQTGSGSTISYPTSTTPYLYFRLILNNIWGSNASVSEIGELYLNFVRPLTSSRPPTHALSMNHTGQYQMVATGSAAGSIMPNQTGLAASTWTQSGVNWGVSSSTNGFGNELNAFNNITTSATWGSVMIYNTTSGAYPGSVSTSIIGVGTSILGEWLQIQTSVPLVLQSYTFACWGVTTIPKTYYIVGSMDGSTWYPLQNVVMSVNPFTTSLTAATSYITTNTTGSFTITSGTTGSGTSTVYSYTTQPWMYFRIVATSLWGSNSGVAEIGEWYMNFSNSVSYSTNYGSTWLNTSSTVSNESVALSSSGQYALSTNSVAPFARLTLDNTNVDAQGVLVPATGAGTPDYTTSIFKVGTRSAQFANATVGGTPTVYLNYTVPTVLNKPSALTMSFWMYPTGYAATSYVITLSNGTQLGPYFYFRTGTVGLAFNINGGAIQYAEYAQGPPVNSWTHIAMTFTGSLLSFYMNGVLLGTMSTSGSLTLSNGGNITNLFVGTLTASTGAFAGNVDDVRLYTSALNAHEVAALYNNPALTQTIAVSSSYLPITSYTKPILPGITANVVDTAVSQTGQYMVAVTSSTTNNVYYSTDFGATFTALTVGSSAMVSCSISYDGSYLTVTNATTTYTLNRNTRGFSVTVGNQAGLVNQAQNAIAIGNQAGRTNQSANSIVLNASGSVLDAVAPGFYVAPVATAASSSAAPFNLLGYGTDNQIVQSSALTVLQNGNMGIGTVAPNFPLDIWGGAASITSSGYTPYLRLQSVFGAAYLSIGSVFGVNTYIGLQCGVTTTSALGTPTLVVTNNNNVGIGTANPSATLDVPGSTRIGPSGAGIILNNSWYKAGITADVNGPNPLAIGPYNDGNWIIAFHNTAGAIRGTIAGVNSTSIGYYTTSDQRRKDNIQDMPSMISKIKALKPRTYSWKESGDKDDGFVAQEVHKVFPQFMTTAAVYCDICHHSYSDLYDGKLCECCDFENPIGKDGTPHYYGLDYGKFTPYLTKALQETIEIVETQTEQITALQVANATLQEENIQLKSQLSSLIAWAQTQGFAL